MAVLFRTSPNEPTASNLERWRHVVDETFGPLQLRAPAGTHLPEQLVAGDVGAVRVSDMRISWGTPASERCQAARTPRLVRRSGWEQYRVEMVARGHMVVEQGGKEAALGPGDFTFVDLSRPARWAIATERAVYLTFPRALLPLRHDEVARLTAVRIPGQEGTGALVSSFARQLVAHLDDYGAADGARLGTAMIDLLSAALAARLDRSEQLPAETRQQVLVGRIHAFIERRLGDPELSPPAIAAAHHVSRRYLYKLFETQPTGVAGHIRRRRLERCRRDLLDPALRARPVSAIAARWGMPDPAHFSRSFRSAYGISPAEYRTTMAKAPSPG
jgi:AraC-like DNA-binding protein